MANSTSSATSLLESDVTVHGGEAGALRPTRRQDRIAAMDVLRGLALLGILVANITVYGLPEWASFIPLGTAKPVFTGPHADVNTAVWFLRWLLIEGKMRALFSLLFGAGVILLTSRIEKRGGSAADIYLRRNMWLTLLGILHAYLAFYGDILYWYGLTALLFLFPCRNLPAATLVKAGVAVLVVNTCFGPFAGGTTRQDFQMHSRAVAARSTATHAALTDLQKADIKAWSDRLEEWKPGKEAIAADQAAMNSGYVGAQLYSASIVARWEADLYYSLAFCDMLGMMLLGMGLFKSGFLTGERSRRAYALTASACFLVSVPLIAAGTWKAWDSDFDLLTTDVWMWLPYDLGRATGAIGAASLLLLIVKSAALPSLTRRLAAVGQTALSNYLLTTILCKVVLVWGPWQLYGKLEYYQLYYLVLAVWALNLTISPIWLRHFEFGPAEWLWRSLTYWRRQPMRLCPLPLGNPLGD
jgi:uncharacterized protein